MLVSISGVEKIANDKCFFILKPSNNARLFWPINNCINDDSNNIGYINGRVLTLPEKNVDFILCFTISKNSAHSS